MHTATVSKKKGGNFTITLRTPKVRNTFRHGTRVAQDRRRKGTRGARTRQALAG